MPYRCPYCRMAFELRSALDNHVDSCESAADSALSPPTPSRGGVRGGDSGAPATSGKSSPVAPTIDYWEQERAANLAVGDRFCFPTDGSGDAMEPALGCSYVVESLASVMRMAGETIEVGISTNGAGAWWLVEDDLVLIARTEPRTVPCESCNGSGVIAS